MLNTLLFLVGAFNSIYCFWMVTRNSKAYTPENKNLRQLLQNGMVLTDAMLKARHAEDYVITQTHEALNAWENELYAAIAQFEEEDDNSCSPV